MSAELACLEMHALIFELQNPPGPCYGVTCSNSGLCVKHDGIEEHCACLPGYSGSACGNVEAAGGRRRLFQSSNIPGVSV